MRIRKHAKISPLLYAASSLQHTTICQLNQSPWDVITFSPDEYLTPATTTPPPPPPPPPALHHQVEQENIFQGNGSFSDSIGVVESVASTKLLFYDNAEEMKNNYHIPKWGYNSDNVAAAEGAKSDFIDVEMEEEKPKSSREQVGKMVEEEIFCSKIDSKGWQCHRIAKSGYTLCVHHLSRLTRYIGFNNLAQENGTRESDESIEHRRRGRPKKPSPSMDPNGYYYYSGFGPKWGGKRRGGQLGICHNNSNNNGSINVSNFETAGIEGGEVPGPSSRIGYRGLDYMVEEEDDEDGSGGSGKKRARKPIKARSLKSLM